MLQQLASTYNYSFTTTSNGHHLSGAALLVVILVVLVAAVIGVAALWKIFTKAGRPGWAAIIPIYNYWVLFEISGKPGWWALSALLGFIPFVGSIIFLVLYIIAMLELAKRFGKSTTFAIFGLVIFSIVGYLMLGFGDAKYSGSGSLDAGAPPATPPATPTPPSVSSTPTAQ